MLILGMILHFSAAAMVVAAVDWLGTIPWRRAAQAHWTERARLLWPALVTEARARYLAPLLLVGIHQYISPQSGLGLVVNAVAGYGGAVLGTFPSTREVFPQIVFRNWLRDSAASFLLKLGVYIPLVGAALAMPNQMGWLMALIATACLAFLLAINRGLFLRLLCQFRIYVPAEPRLRQIVADTSARMRVPVSATWQLPSVSANAFALVTSRELLFTTRLLEICSDAELAAICSHELAHLAEPKSIRRRRQLYALVGIFPFIFIVPAFHAFGVAGLMLPYFGVLYRRLLSTKLSQRMEQRADFMALSEQASAGVYARALGKLYEANHMPAVSGRTTAAHPHLFDRMVAAGITPDYARPSAPDRSNWLGELLNAAAVIIGVVNLILFFRRMDPSAGD